jgi:hypothetical protein
MCVTVSRATAETSLNFSLKHIMFGHANKELYYLKVDLTS